MSSRDSVLDPATARAAARSRRILHDTFTLTASSSSLDLTLRGTFSLPTALAGDGNARYESSPFCNGLRTNFTYTANK